MEIPWRLITYRKFRSKRKTPAWLSPGGLRNRQEGHIEGKTLLILPTETARFQP